MNCIHLGTLAHTPRSPFQHENALDIYRDGALLVDQNGRIGAMGSRAEVCAAHPTVRVQDHGSAWLIPGLIDGHIHFPQFYATASYGQQLLDWLTASIFPAEQRYQDVAYAQAAAEKFVGHLLRMGTTTALVFGSQFVPAMEALFDAAQRQGLRLISGLTLMDRGAPEALLTSPERAYRESKALIQRLAGAGSVHYAITPRFAISCTPAMLDMCGQLKREHPECFVQTHIHESLDEITGTLALFPGAADYLEVYDRAGLVGPRTVLAHSIHTSDSELAVMRDRGASVCHCPCSNLMLGSGLFSLSRHLQAQVPVMMGTDVGAGGHFCILRELADAYKVQQLQRFTLSAGHLLYLGTLGGAVGLSLHTETGCLTPGKMADFLVLDPSEDGYLRRRLEHCESLSQQLFVLLHQAGPAHLRATYVQGRNVTQKATGGI